VLVQLDGLSIPSLYEAVAAIDAAGLHVVIVPSGKTIPQPVTCCCWRSLAMIVWGSCGRSRQP
jgi:hypothetical protein